MDNELSNALREFLQIQKVGRLAASRGAKLLQETSDPAAFPMELQDFITLAPPLYNSTLRQFQFQRTPNLYVVVEDLACVAAIDTAINPSATPSAPKDGTKWKVLGGYITLSVASMFDIKDGAASDRFLFHGGVGALQATLFVLPGNGMELQRPPLTVNYETGGTVDLLLFVSEESDTIGRGGS
jgi:hypothetical protein